MTYKWFATVCSAHRGFDLACSVCKHGFWRDLDPDLVEEYERLGILVTRSYEPIQKKRHSRIVRPDFDI